jgi:hypothetical protein
MYKNILAVLTADEAKPLGIVKPLHCSLFHDDSFLITNEILPQKQIGVRRYSLADIQSVSNDD